MTCHPLVIAVCVVVSPAGRVLFVKRKEFYELPGGKIECGEDPREAARRELWEETALKLASKELSLEGAVALQGYENEPVLALVYSAKVVEEKECSNCAWLDPVNPASKVAPGTREILSVVGLGEKDL